MFWNEQSRSTKNDSYWINIWHYKEKQQNNAPGRNLEDVKPNRFTTGWSKTHNEQPCMHSMKSIIIVYKTTTAKKK